MTAAGPYLTVTDLERQLTLHRIDCPLTVRPGIHRAFVAGSWIEVYAVEPRISTGAAPIRAVQLRASGRAVPDLLRLEAELRARGGPLQMETPERRSFAVSFKDLRATLLVYGTFHQDRDDPELEYRITLGDREIIGVAIDRDREGRRGLALADLAFEDEEALARAFTSSQAIVVDRVELGGSAAAPPGAPSPEKPLDDYPLQALVEAVATVVAKQQGFDGAELRRHVTDLKGQVQRLVQLFQIKAAEEQQRKHTAGEVERLLDAIAQTGTAAGQSIAAHREAIVQAFRGVDLARIADGLQVLTAWLRNPTEDKSAQVQELIANLQAAMGPMIGRDPAREAEARREQIRQDARASVEQILRNHAKDDKNEA